MAYDGMYGDLSTRGTVNDILNEALAVQAVVVPLADQVEQDAADVADAASVILPIVPVFQQAVIDAQSAAVTAVAAQGAASSSASAAASSASTSAANVTLSQKWATNPEDVVVSGGQYSAYHWAQKAAAIATGNLDAIYLRRDGNLGNISSPSAARSNLGLGTAATTDSSSYQPVATKLTNFNATTNTADSVIYNTGTSTFGVSPLTSFARSILDDTDAATVRATLGLGTAAVTASTAYQPVATKLTNFNATSNSADTLVYNTAATTYAVTPLTSFMRTLLDDTDAATARATLGVTAAPSAGQLKAWATVTNAGILLAGYNILSVAKGSTGVYTFTFNTPMADLLYGVSGTPTAGATPGILYLPAVPTSTSSIEVRTCTGAGSFTDYTRTSVQFFGN